MSAVLEFFDLLASHLLSQKQKSCTKSGRPLTYSKGNKDPLGFVIPRKKWKKEFDKQGIYNEDAQKALALEPENLEVLMEVQAIHDIIIPEKWGEWLAIFKGRRDGSIPIFDEEEEE